MAEDPAKNAAYLARKAAAMFYKFHREGPKGRRFAKPREFAAWDPVDLLKYKKHLDEGYPDGIPSGKPTEHLRERYTQLEEELERRVRYRAILQALLDDDSDDELGPA